MERLRQPNDSSTYSSILDIFLEMVSSWILPSVPSPRLESRVGAIRSTIDNFFFLSLYNISKEYIRVYICIYTHTRIYIFFLDEYIAAAKKCALNVDHVSYAFSNN